MNQCSFKSSVSDVPENTMTVTISGTQEVKDYNNDRIQVHGAAILIMQPIESISIWNWMVLLNLVNLFI